MYSSIAFPLFLVVILYQVLDLAFLSSDRTILWPVECFSVFPIFITSMSTSVSSYKYRLAAMNARLPIVIPTAVTFASEI